MRALATFFAARIDLAQGVEEALKVAVFQFNNRSIPYHSAFAPFAKDLLLLQGADAGPEFWQPVLEDLHEMPSSGGRILTCEWYEPGRGPQQLGEDLARLMRTLGLASVYLVACDEAVDVARVLQQQKPAIIEKTLLFSDGAPKGEALIHAVRAFCQF